MFRLCRISRLLLQKAKQPEVEQAQKRSAAAPPTEPAGFEPEVKEAAASQGSDDPLPAYLEYRDEGGYSLLIVKVLV